MHMELVSGSANDSTINYKHHLAIDPWGKGNVEQLAGDRIPHQEVLPLPVEDKDTAMVAAKNSAGRTDPQGEAFGRDAVRRWTQHCGEFDVSKEIDREEAEERGLLVVGAEVAEETGVRD